MGRMTADLPFADLPFSGLPFSGLKVIDCASFIAGPAAATVLADFGADVIKIEPPGAGDPYRAFSAMPGQPLSPHNHGWLMDGRSRRSLALDLKEPAGREVLYKLVATADVFITNYPQPVRRRLGLAFDDLAPRNPRLIYAALSAYGETGPEAEKTGFDATAYWARSGLMDVVRADAEAAPGRSTPGMGDHPTAMALYGAIVTALYRRERTGKGGFVASSLLANGLWANGYLMQARLCGADIPPRPKRAASPNALAAMYCCADGRWFLLVMLSEDRQWPAFANAIGRTDLTLDPRFLSSPLRRANATALLGILDDLFATAPLGHWRELLDAAGVTFGLVGTTDEAAVDAQALAAGMLPTLEGTGLRTVNSPLHIAPLHIDGAAMAPPRLAPALGQHSRDVLAEAGFAPAEIESLVTAGIIFNAS
jgi:crotonobetainyl-CoA:carnitine CoA-transferase CaiB-like acyl-CoA transferase